MLIIIWLLSRLILSTKNAGILISTLGVILSLSASIIIVLGNIALGRVAKYFAYACFSVELRVVGVLV